MREGETTTSTLGGLLSRIVTATIVAGALLLLLFGALTLRSYNALTAENDRYHSALDVENGVIGMISALFTLESIHSSTVLTGEESARSENFDEIVAFFDSYQGQVSAALPELPESLQTGLSELVAGAVSQRNDIVALRTMAKTQGPDTVRDATRDTYVDFGQARLMAPFVSFQTAQDELATTQKARIRRLRQRLAGLVVASLVASLMIGVGLVSYILHSVSRLATSHVQIRSAKADTQTAWQARDVAVHEQERVESLLEDMNHRVGNSLGMVSALMGLQRSQSQNEDVREALAAARRRIHSVATAHRRLRLSADMATTELAPVLDGVAEDLVATMPRQDIALHTDFAPMRVGDRDAVTIGLLMSELVTNALKHAFAGRDGGTVWVRTEVDASGGFSLHVEDDGVGMAEAARPGGLGTSVIKRMSAQYGGSLRRVPSDTGTHWIIDLPQLAFEAPRTG